jgi:pimeloyl-ACP methyl ester carboxylesterase
MGGRAWADAVSMAVTAGMGGGRAAAQGEASPPFPPPGRLVDVGGWRLHLNCTGDTRGAAPTVILEAGASDFSSEWSLVQPSVSAFARVCSYDRAGEGWSDLGPHPRTMRQVVYELHTLLGRAGVQPPYVLVGQSYGGVLVRLFQITYPAEVTGMVFVDAGRLNPRRFVNGELVKFADMATGRPIPAVQTSNPLRVADIPAPALMQIQAAALQSVPTANESRAKLPAEAKAMRTWVAGQIKKYAAYVNPFEAEELALMINDQSAKEHPLGDMPLVVLTAAKSDLDEPWLEDERRREQADLAKLSSNGRQIVTNTGHHIHIEEPPIVIGAIRDVWQNASHTTKR